MLHTWGRSVRASNPKNVMVRTVVTPEILNGYYVRTPIFDVGRAYLHYNLKPCNVSPNSL